MTFWLETPKKYYARFSMESYNTVLTEIYAKHTEILVRGVFFTINIFIQYWHSVKE